MSYRTIKLKKYTDIINEYEAAAAFLPGHVLELTSDNQVQKHSTAGGPSACMFALEDELQGKTTRDAFAAEDRVQVWHVQPGEEVLALIASAFDPAIGALLEVAGDGTLRAVAAGVAQFQVIAAKEVDDEDNHRVAVRRI